MSSCSGCSAAMSAVSAAGAQGAAMSKDIAQKLDKEAPIKMAEMAQIIDLANKKLDITV
jgi:hypothetical protein